MSESEIAKALQLFGPSMSSCDLNNLEKIIEDFFVPNEPEDADSGSDDGKLQSKIIIIT